MSDLLLTGLLGWLFLSVGWLIALTAHEPGFEYPAERIVRIVWRLSGVFMFLGGGVTVIAALVVKVLG